MVLKRRFSASASMSEHRKKKKRSRENDDEEDTTARKRKRSKSDVHSNGDYTQPTEPEPMAPVGDEESPKRKKKKKKKHQQQQQEQRDEHDCEDRVKTESTSPVQGDETGDDHGGQDVNVRGEEERDAHRGEKKMKKSRKEKSLKGSDDQVTSTREEGEAQADAVQAEPAKKKSKHRKHVEKDVAESSGGENGGKKSKKRKKHVVEEDPEPTDVEVDVDAGDKRQKKKSKKEKKRNSEAAVEDVDHGEAVDAEEDVTFPFYTQTVSLYLALYPQGFSQPITAARKQHLDPMLNHYSPALRGVPLAYRNVSLGERPVRAEPGKPPSDETHALLRSVDEYAVGFGYLTADFDMFIPRRGAWMEGLMNLQTDGHIGLLCFDRFNASIEAKRLPRGWKWVEVSEEEQAPQPADADGFVQEPPAQDDGYGYQDGGADAEPKVAQLQASGYWADESGARVVGKIRFRIHALDAGTWGDCGYLSIRGTMLDEETERKLAAEERAVDRQRRDKLNPHRILRPAARRLPESSMTRFDAEEEGGAW